MTNKLITIGCDPEVFVIDSSTKEFVSAHGLLPGNKENPHVVKDGAIQIDGMACEFNTDPVTTREDFVSKVQSVFASMTSQLPSGIIPVPGVPVAHFSPEVYSAQPYEALELGCEPDYDAYSMGVNPRPDVSTGTMRTAAGHIHIGFTSEMVSDPFNENHFKDCCSLVKHLDATLGVYSLTYDQDVERRSLYGAAGAFRPKEYGVEYRVLSNAWLLSPDLMGEVFDRTVKATQQWMAGEVLPDFMHTKAREIINESSVDVVPAFLSAVGH